MTGRDADWAGRPPALSESEAGAGRDDGVLGDDDDAVLDGVEVVDAVGFAVGGQPPGEGRNDLQPLRKRFGL